MIRLLTVAALATSLAACGPGGGDDDYEPDYTPEEWFPIGTWQIDSLSGFLEKSILVVAPPLLDLGQDEEGENIRFDPRLDYGAPYRITVFQPYTLQAPSGPIRCYHQSTPQDQTIQGGDTAGFGALYDPTITSPAFIHQYNANKSDFSGSIAEQVIETTLSVEDIDGKWLADYSVKGTLLATVDYETSLEVQQQLQEINVGTTCKHGGFNDEFTGINMPELLKGIEVQDRTTLDLPRQPLDVGKSYNTNNGSIVTILSENGDRVQVSISGIGYLADGNVADYKTVQTGGTYSVRNGVQYWTLDRTLQAFQEIQPSPTGFNSETGEIYWPPRYDQLITDLSGFGMLTPSAIYFPDYPKYKAFPSTLKAVGNNYYYGGCTTCISPIQDLWSD